MLYQSLLIVKSQSCEKTIKVKMYNTVIIPAIKFNLFFEFFRDILSIKKIGIVQQANAKSVRDINNV